MSKKPTFFWASYADLMTSLFFIMLVLFVLTVVVLKRTSEATEQELAKIKAIQESVNKIDTTYFAYSELYKKHILKIDVEFQTKSYDISNIPNDTRDELIKAGEVIKNFLNDANLKLDAKYLLVIEGQASKDNYWENDDLSFRRALALKYFWINNGISLDNLDNCELIVAGSGQGGCPRVEPDNKWNTANQRFLIHIIPKPGIIKNDTIKSL